MSAQDKYEAANKHSAEVFSDKESTLPERIEALQSEYAAQKEYEKEAGE